MSVTALTFQVEMGPYVASAAAGLPHQSLKARVSQARGHSDGCWARKLAWMASLLLLLRAVLASIRTTEKLSKMSWQRWDRRCSTNE